MNSQPRQECSDPGVWKVALLAILLAIAVVGLLIGMSACTRSFELLERRRSLEALPAAAEVQVGDACFAEGSLARTSPAPAGELVAYQVSEYRARSWKPVEGRVPPFVIETRGGPDVSVDAGYGFATDLRAWPHETREAPPAGFSTGAVRTEILVVGRPVLAVGRRLPDAAGTLRMEAETVAGVDRAIALELWESASANSRLVSRFTLLAGVLALAAAAAVWRWLPSTRRPRPARRGEDPQAYW